MAAAAHETMTGMVPAARHSAVSIPIMVRQIRIFLMVFTPETAESSISRAVKPFRRPYAKNSTKPAASAHSTDFSSTTHTSSMAEKRPSVANSMFVSLLSFRFTFCIFFIYLYDLRYNS